MVVESGMSAPSSALPKASPLDYPSVVPLDPPTALPWVHSTVRSCSCPWWVQPCVLAAMEWVLWSDHSRALPLAHSTAPWLGHMSSKA
jgi:hypothetical protein